MFEYGTAKGGLVQRMGLFRVILCLVTGRITVTAAVDPAKASFAKDILPLQVTY